MFNKSNFKGLTTAAIAAGVLLVASSANAAVSFRPGTSDTGGGVGCDAATSNIHSVFGASPANLCDGSAAVALDFMTWNTADIGLGDVRWNMSIDTQTGAFSETFMMALSTTTRNGVDTGYGEDPANSYVSMEMNLFGQMDTFDTDFGTTELVGSYNALSSMTMRFHSDGIIDAGLADGAIIAEFNLTNGGDVQDGNISGITELVFRADFDTTAGTPSGILLNGSTDFNDLLNPILKVTTNTFNDGFVLSSDPTGLTVVRVGDASEATSSFQVPEPSAIALLGLGLIGIGAAVRRKRITA